MKKIKVVVIIIAYVIFWWVTWTGTLASSKAMYPHMWSKHSCRENMAFFMGWSALPVVPWVIGPFVTGFYQDGFISSCKDASDDNLFDK